MIRWVACGRRLTSRLSRPLSPAPARLPSGGPRPLSEVPVPMLTAVTRAPGPELARCELTHLPRVPIDTELALAQHRAYQSALRGAGVRVVELPSDPSLPDGVFVEDAAVVLDEVA